jgi:hypothetical protein
VESGWAKWSNLQPLIPLPGSSRITRRRLRPSQAPILCDRSVGFPSGPGRHLVASRRRPERIIVEIDVFPESIGASASWNRAALGIRLVGGRPKLGAAEVAAPSLEFKQLQLPPPGGCGRRDCAMPAEVGSRQPRHSLLRRLRARDRGRCARSVPRCGSMGVRRAESAGGRCEPEIVGVPCGVE